MVSEKIRMVLAKRDRNKSWLAKQLGWSTSNLYNKLGRDNFSERELREIAEALGCNLEINFVLKDSGEKF
jgi:DNA-binding Xre family transcriptional regulator